MLRTWLTFVVTVLAVAANAWAVSPPDRTKATRGRSQTQAVGTPSMSGRPQQPNPGNSGAAAQAKLQQRLADLQAAQQQRLRKVPQKPSIVADRPTPISTARPAQQSGGGYISNNPAAWPPHLQEAMRKGQAGNRVTSDPRVPVNRPNRYDRPAISPEYLPGGDRYGTELPARDPRPFKITNNQFTIDREAVQRRLQDRDRDRYPRDYDRRHDYGHHDHHHGWHDGYNHALHYHWRPSSWAYGYRPTYSSYYHGNLVGGGLITGNITFVNPFFPWPTSPLAYSWADYSRPIHVPDAGYRETTADLISSERAIRKFDEARAAFQSGNYGSANNRIDEALSYLPNDPTLHQFRALVLFARQRPQEAAAALYAVLSVSAGWDWETVARLYGDLDDYQKQLGQLERVALSNPEMLDARFLLAYHYLVWGEYAAAWHSLDSVRQANPRDPVVLGLMQAIREQAAADRLR